jgi:hypothetical protein
MQPLSKRLRPHDLTRERSTKPGTVQTVVTHAWLRERGVSRDLSREYVKSGWLERLGNGTFKRPRETVS